jgi:hypothetical protein
VYHKSNNSYKIYLVICINILCTSFCTLRNYKRGRCIVCTPLLAPMTKRYITKNNHIFLNTSFHIIRVFIGIRFYAEESYVRFYGRAIDQAVIRCLPTAAARVRAWVWSCGIFGRKRGDEAGFFPSTSVSPANLYSTKFSILTIIRGRYNRPEVADVASGPSMDSTPTPHPNYVNLNKF